MGRVEGVGREVGEWGEWGELGRVGRAALDGASGAGLAGRASWARRVNGYGWVVRLLDMCLTAAWQPPS